MILAGTHPKPTRPLAEVLAEHVDLVRAERARQARAAQIDAENAARSAELQQNAAVDRRVAELRAERQAGLICILCRHLGLGHDGDHLPPATDQETR